MRYTYSLGLSLAMLDQITHLLRLHTILEVGSLRRAAEQLNITQPALSRSLAQLEAHFGQKLVERHARGVRPTSFGLRVLAVSNRLERYWDIAEKELRGPAQADAPVLRIGAGPAWRSGVLSGVFAEMQHRYPDMQIVLTPAPYGQGVALLNDGKLDVVFGGIINDRAPRPNITRHELTQVTNRIFAREDHPLFSVTGADGTLPPARILEYPWIVYSELPIYREVTDHNIAERLGGRPRVAMVCQNLLPVLTMLQRSDSLCLLPDLAVGAATQPRLRALPVDLRFNTAEVGVLLREELSDWAPVRTLVDLCRAQFGVSAPQAAAAAPGRRRSAP